MFKNQKQNILTSENQSLSFILAYLSLLHLMNSHFSLNPLLTPPPFPSDSLNSHSGVFSASLLCKYLLCDDFVISISLFFTSFPCRYFVFFHPVSRFCLSSSSMLECLSLWGPVGKGRAEMAGIPVLSSRQTRTQTHDLMAVSTFT